MRVVRTKQGARIVQEDVVLSEMLARPGPTHTLFDTLAAAIAALSPGPRVAMLGFAGGGVIAPLRAMGFAHPVDAVDLSRDGEPLFRELSSAWAGEVNLFHEDAEAWLRCPRAPYHSILEDLSTPSPLGVIKPYASIDTLPALIRARLAPEGVCIVNVLPLPGTSWDELLHRVASPYGRSFVVTVPDYENRVVVAGDALPDVGRRLREALLRIGSDQVRGMRVRALAP